MRDALIVSRKAAIKCKFDVIVRNHNG